MNATYQDIVAIVDFFESGVNHKTLPAIVKAFELIGGMLKDFGDAITACVAEAKDLASKLKELAASLSGNVLSIIKVVIDDLVRKPHHVIAITIGHKVSSAHQTDIRISVIVPRRPLTYLTTQAMEHASSPSRRTLPCQCVQQPIIGARPVNCLCGAGARLPRTQGDHRRRQVDSHPLACGRFQGRWGRCGRHCWRHPWRARGGGAPGLGRGMSTGSDGQGGTRCVGTSTCGRYVWASRPQYRMMGLLAWLPPCMLGIARTRDGFLGILEPMFHSHSE